MLGFGTDEVYLLLLNVRGALSQAPWHLRGLCKAHTRPWPVPPHK